MQKKFKIGDKTINNGRTFVVAEISANHKGDIKTAKKLIIMAKKSGADAVKIQSYIPESLTINSTNKDFLLKKKNKWSKYKNLFNLYKEGQTPISWHRELFEFAKKQKIIIFSSPFDENFVDILESLNCVAYKIASPEINHYPLLIKVAKTKKPIIISTGTAYEHDIKNAVKILKTNGCKKLIILKCDTNYPSSTIESNFSSIRYLRKKYNIPIGFSDHTIGSEAPLISIIFGSCLIEKHFVLKNQKSLDSFFSSTPEKFKQLVNKIRIIEKENKKNEYKISPSSKNNRTIMRSIYISKNVKKNEIVSKENIKIVRPHYGLDPKYYFNVMGKKFIHNFKSGERLTFSKIK